MAAKKEAAPVTTDNVVEQIEQKTNELIALCETLKDRSPSAANVAQSAYREAASYAVKAANS